MQNNDSRNFPAQPEEQYTSDVANTFLQHQKRELDLRMREFEHAKLEEEHRYNFMCQALEAQKVDRKESRSHWFKMTITVAAVFLSFALLASVFCAFALWRGESALVKDIFNNIVVFTGGMGAGFGVSRWLNKKSPDRQP